MKFNFQHKEKELAELLSRAGAELGYPVYFVGGFVRDRFLNKTSKDIDIVCVGDGIELART
ncbi:MAG: tRNA nucleotidyltransferase, partial [Saprospiraceae bacterium]|nr:tRNA nucleotidyltransferase [Saprospiraceae bacterium]